VSVVTKPAKARGRAQPEEPTPPHSVEAEKGVLSSIMRAPGDAIPKCAAAGVSAFWFHVPAHHTIYRELLDMWDSGGAIDLITFTVRLRGKELLDGVGNAVAVTEVGTYLDKIYDHAPTAANLPHYIDIVRDMYVRRQIIRAAELATRRAYDALPNADMGDLLEELSSSAVSLHSLLRSLREPERPLIEFRSPLQLKNFTPAPGLELVGDFHIVKGSVFVEGGPPGVGKSRGFTALAIAGATGCDWFGYKVHRQFKTLIVQTENGEFRLAREFAELDCETLENFVRICPPPPYGLCFQRSDFRAQLAEAIADFKPDLVGFDPWNAAAREQDSREYLDTFEALKSVLPLGDDAPALGIVAHTRKPRTDERSQGRALLNLLAGSYVLGSVPRTVFVMQAASDDTTDNRIVWTCCKNNDGDLGKRSAWERRSGLFVPVHDFDWDEFDAAEKDKRELITEADVRAIFTNGALTRAEAEKQLESNTGAHRSSCYRALQPDSRFAKHLHVEGERIKWK
jgi:hypothetical protein